MELVMLNQISNNICRTAKINVIRFDNDASACCNRIRILVHLGMMAACQCGMPDNALQVHAGTLQKMKYRVKDNCTDYPTTVTKRPMRPRLFGTGQGSGALALAV
jgi:hypothetical protein